MSRRLRESVQVRLKKAEKVLAGHGYEYENGQYVNVELRAKLEIMEAVLKARAEMDAARTRLAQGAKDGV